MKDDIIFIDIKFFIDKEGDVYVEGEKVSNENIKNFILKNLVEIDNEWYLVVGKERAKVFVEDIPYVVRQIFFIEGEEILIKALLNNGEEKISSPQNIFFRNGVFYLSIGNEIFRFSRKAHHELIKYLEDDLILKVSEKRFKIDECWNGRERDKKNS